MNDAPEVTISLSFGEARKGARDLVDTAMDDKKDRREVNYRPAPTDTEMCRLCTNWCGDDQDTDAECKEIGGRVEAGDLCDVYEATGADDDSEESDDKKAPPFGGGVSDKEPET